MSDEKPADQPQDKPKENSSKIPKADYRPEDLQHLSDMEHVAQATGHVYRRYYFAGAPPPRLRGRRQFDRRGHGWLCGSVNVTVNTDGSVTVEDDGRGVPVDLTISCPTNWVRDVSTLEGVM